MTFLFRLARILALACASCFQPQLVPQAFELKFTDFDPGAGEGLRNLLLGCTHRTWSGSCVSPSPAPSPCSLWLQQAKVQPGYVVSVGDSVIAGLRAPGGCLITVSFDCRNCGGKSLDPGGTHSQGGTRREH